MLFRSAVREARWPNGQFAVSGATGPSESPLLGQLCCVLGRGT